MSTTLSEKDLIKYYQDKKDHFAALLTHESKKINVISNIRLATALLFIGAVYMTFQNRMYAIPTILLLGIFIWLVYRHAKLFVRKTHLENLVKVNLWEVKSLQGDQSDYATGSEFIDQHHPYTHDLDIFGPDSLYHHLNRCNTRWGRARFAQLLSAALPDRQTISAHQHAVLELAAKTEFRQDFQAAGLEADEQRNDQDELNDWLTLQPFLFGKNWIRIAIWLLPVLTITSLLAIIFFPVPKLVFFSFVVVQWLVTSNYAKQTITFHEYVSRKKSILIKYAQILKYMQPQQFQSPMMQQLRDQALDADTSVEKLANLVNLLNARLNSIMWLAVNSLLLYDVNCVYRLEKWKSEHASKLMGWLNTIYETEVLCSLGTFAFNHPTFIFPTIHEQVSIEAAGMGHPLVSAEKCVTNDFHLGGDGTVFIVTGANMAGKSTFLRTIGTNVVLALAGAPVFAGKFVCPVIPIRSGMRTADSLKDNESYFYAELNRLKTIMDELRNGKSMLVLLDEILKGTNSGDKQKGSISLVRQLVNYPCLTIVATHDLILGDLEKEFPGRVKNYCFEANIEDDQLSFDYLLKPGLATKMNATFLMKKMGIIPG